MSLLSGQMRSRIIILYFCLFAMNGCCYSNAVTSNTVITGKELYFCFDRCNLFEYDENQVRYFVNGQFVGQGRAGLLACCKRLEIEKPVKAYMIFPVNEKLSQVSGPSWTLPYIGVKQDDAANLMEKARQLHILIYDLPLIQVDYQHEK